MVPSKSKRHTRAFWAETPGWSDSTMLDLCSVLLWHGERYFFTVTVTFLLFVPLELAADIL